MGLNNLIGVVVELYYIVLVIIKVVKKIVVILLERMVLIFFICNFLYRCCGGWMLRWNRFVNMFNVFVVIWWEVIFFGIKGLKFFMFYVGFIGCIFFVSL